MKPYCLAVKATQIKILECYRPNIHTCLKTIVTFWEERSPLHQGRNGTHIFFGKRKRTGLFGFRQGCLTALKAIVEQAQTSTDIHLLKLNVEVSNGN